MKRAHNYLVSKGKSDSDVMKFKHQLYDLWFKLYRRSVFYELRLHKVVDALPIVSKNINNSMYSYYKDSTIALSLDYRPIVVVRGQVALFKRN